MAGAVNEGPYGRALERYITRLKRRLQPLSIILYGSTALGTQGVGSDIDLLVISDRLPDNFLERLRILGELNGTTAPIEALGYTPKEFRGMLRRLHATALSAVEDGIAMHDTGFFKEERAFYRRLKRRLHITRVEGGWESRRTPVSHHDSIPV
jgi:predicted nucleotidyltransferase